MAPFLSLPGANLAMTGANCASWLKTISFLCLCLVPRSQNPWQWISVTFSSNAFASWNLNLCVKSWLWSNFSSISGQNLNFKPKNCQNCHPNQEQKSLGTSLKVIFWINWMKRWLKRRNFLSQTQRRVWDCRLVNQLLWLIACHAPSMQAEAAAAWLTLKWTICTWGNFPFSSRW